MKYIDPSSFFHEYESIHIEISQKRFEVFIWEIVIFDGKLLFCASIVGFIPFFGNLAGLLSIGGGALYLLDLPRFKSDEKAE